MLIFGLREVNEEVGEVVTTIEPRGEAEGLVPKWVAAKWQHVNDEISPDKLKTRLEEAISEASHWFSSEMKGLAAGVSVEKISVELGVTIGGEVGLFAKGRTDIAASFTVELKVAHKSSVAENK